MFFVMLRNQHDQALPLVDDDGLPMLYEDEDEATEAAEENLLGWTYGFEVYEW